MEKNKADHRAKETEFEILERNLVIHLNQELDHHCAIKLREKSDKLIEKGNIQNIIFDFEGIGFMDSSGIGVIMGRYKRVIFTGGKVAVVVLVILLTGYYIYQVSIK